MTVPNFEAVGAMGVEINEVHYPKEMQSDNPKRKYYKYYWLICKQLWPNVIELPVYRWAVFAVFASGQVNNELYNEITFIGHKI